ncbi:MAG TPA: FliM/FliN family flagellar motor switch protein, partial [Stellaceae bacterium]|nr:FliM/FliN family flagellar motor switch protein [Stellaceae bacterium]
VELPLRDVLNLKVGSRILLNADVNADVGLVCGDLAMFTGKMGRKGGHIAIRIGEKMEKDGGQSL